MKTTFLLFIITCVFGCYSKNETKQHDSIPKKVKKDSQIVKKDTFFLWFDDTTNYTQEFYDSKIIIPKWYIADSICKNGNFIKIIATATDTGKTAIAYWGNRKIKRTLDMSKELKWLKMFNRDDIKWQNKDFIAIELGCGTGCQEQWVFPIDEKKPPKNYILTITNNPKENLLVYDDFIVEDVKTNKRDTADIILNKIPDYDKIVALRYAFDSIYVTHKFIFMGQRNKRGKIIYKQIDKLNLR